ncbi:MAG: hypothetical protein IPJ12_00420 [Betaproteobacteria bacterium]|nr:hypothetical protein [Betaproteobacteria bacterium]
MSDIIGKPVFPLLRLAIAISPDALRPASTLRIEADLYEDGNECPMVLMDLT